MEIELQFNSVIVQPAEMQEQYPLIFSTLQSFIPVLKPAKVRRPRRKRARVGSLIDSIIEDIERVQ